MAVRVVIDTSVLVRGVLGRSAAREVFDLALERTRVVGVTSPQLLEELFRILSLAEVRSLVHPPLGEDLVDRVVRQVAERFELTPGTLREIDEVPDQAKQNPVIEAALEAGAACIVSDDPNLLLVGVIRVRDFSPVRVYSAGSFVRRTPV